MPDRKSPNPALTKAYEKATGDGPIETTLELTEAQIKKLIRAADRVILDAADVAKKVPGATLDAAKIIADAGVDGLKTAGNAASAAGKGIFGAIKAIGNFAFGTTGEMPLTGPNSAIPQSPKITDKERGQLIRDSRADNVKPKKPLPKRKVAPTEGMLPRTPVPKRPGGQGIKLPPTL